MTEAEKKVLERDLRREYRFFKWLIGGFLAIGCMVLVAARLAPLEPVPKTPFSNANEQDGSVLLLMGGSWIVFISAVAALFVYSDFIRRRKKLRASADMEARVVRKDLEIERKPGKIERVKAKDPIVVN